MIILNIHGFGSHGVGNKATILKNVFGKDKVLSPSLPNNPELAFQTLKNMVDVLLTFDKDILLIGTSLGGFFALNLSNEYGLKCVLINPSINPYVGLSNVINKLSINYFDMSHFVYTQENINFLKSLKIENYDSSKIMLILQKDDSVIDYKTTLEHFQNIKNVHIGDGGGHQCKNFDEYVSTIKEFF